MTGAARTLLHALLLGLLAAGVLYAAMMVTGTLMMLAMPGRRDMLTGLSATEIGYGAAMAVMWSAVVGVGLAALLGQLRRNAALATWIADQGREPSQRLVAAIEASGRPVAVVEVPAEQAFAFTHRVWHPQVAISSGLVAATTPEELAAVVAHEASHVRHRDPLKVLAFRTWSAAFGFLPVVRAVFRRLLERQEIRADRGAVRAVGTRPVAGALLKAVDRPDAAPGTTLAAMAGPDLLEHRVVHLETGHAPGVLAAVPPMLTPSLPGFAGVAAYAVLLYHVCSSAPFCCSW